MPGPIDDDVVAAKDAWTQRELSLLHDMVRDYDRARWLRGQLKWWGLWIVGLPTALVSVYKAIEQIILTMKGFH